MKIYDAKTDELLAEVNSKIDIIEFLLSGDYTLYDVYASMSITSVLAITGLISLIGLLIANILVGMLSIDIVYGAIIALASVLFGMIYSYTKEYKLYLYFNAMVNIRTKQYEYKKYKTLLDATYRAIKEIRERKKEVK